MHTYRARWISARGEVLRDETFEFDPTTAENYAWVRPDYRDTHQAADAPYVSTNHAAINQHLEGYIEAVMVDPRMMVMVNEDGGRRADEWGQNPHPAMLLASARYGQRLIGPAVLFERETREPAVEGFWHFDPEWEYFVDNTPGRPQLIVLAEQVQRDPALVLQQTGLDITLAAWLAQHPTPGAYKSVN